MPNPLVSQQIVTSDEPPREGLDPIVETYEGVNLAYRGTQNHGVPAELGWIDPRTTVQRGAEVPYEEPEPEPEPVPVRIVSSGGRETRTAHMWHTYAPANDKSPTSIVGRDPRRSKLTIRNLHATDRVYVGPTQQHAASMNGWPLDAGATMETASNEPLWAGSSTANQVELAMWVETGVAL